jgi:NADH-quinone oxidoreductase subunit C
MDINNLLEKLKIKFPEIHFETSEFRNEFTISFEKRYITEVCQFIKNDSEFSFSLCEDITAIDWARGKKRFSIIYFLYSIKNNFRIKIKCDVENSDCVIDSVSTIWKSADWAEREVYDMYGVVFKNHPDLRRMYMPEDFEYYPLRKEFPLMGIPGSLPLPKK